MKKINYVLSIIFIIFLLIQVLLWISSHINIIIMISVGILYFTFDTPKNENTPNRLINDVPTKNTIIDDKKEFKKFKVVYSINSTCNLITDFIYARNIAEAQLRLKANPKVIRIGNICPVPY